MKFTRTRCLALAICCLLLAGGSSKTKAEGLIEGADLAAAAFATQGHMRLDPTALAP